MILDVLLSEPLIWIVIGVIFAIIEAVTMGLTTIWFTIGAVAACLVALLGGPLAIQIIVFLVVSILLLYFTRPLAEKKLKIGHEKNNVDQVVGKTALVTEEIKPFQPGQVKLNGLVWTAVTKDNQQSLVAGSLAIIVGLEGVKLIVERKGEE